MRFLNIVLFSFFFVLFIGCGEKPIFAEKNDLGGSWNYDDKLSFQIEINKLDLSYDLVLSLTYGQDFGYQNIYVKIITQYPNGKEDEDILSLNLTNGQGIFLGDCSSSKCEIDLLLQEKFKFNQEGKHVITILQNGRVENLEDVYAVELKLFNLKEN